MSVETRLTTKGSSIGPFHRAQIMEEMHAGSVAELVRVAAGQLGIAPQG
jgi:FixJ family two-component response regulator